jgi:hypothetical protein
VLSLPAVRTYGFARSFVELLHNLIASVRRPTTLWFPAAPCGTIREVYCPDETVWSTCSHIERRPKAVASFQA